VKVFGAVHLVWLAAIATVAAVVAWGCHTGRISQRVARLAAGYGLMANELVWWIFRYSHEGVHWHNLPLQLCDATLWAAVGGCLFRKRTLVEFAYFGGMAGAGMALLTPDLWSPWPSYPAVYFFVAHGGIVVASAALVFGGIAPLERGALWRATGMLAIYAAAVGTLDGLTGANYMYLRQKPAAASLLNALGRWPVYLVTGFAVALVLFWALWLAAKSGGGVRER
jgi:hypothetical integral membrane protein (TIGR02206 family)